MTSKNIYRQSWYTSRAGRLLADAEKAELDKLLPQLYGFHLLHIAESSLASFINSSLISNQLMLNLAGRSHQAQPVVCAHLENLPFLSNNIDVVVLTHALEQADCPHQILREAHRILIPEGHLVITGFNPYSCWGLWIGLKKWLGKAPNHGKLLSLNRLRDWLKLLDFQVIGGGQFYFRPPLANVKWLNKLKFLEKWGARWWPFLGGAYTLVAVKRVVTLTPVQPSWRFKKSLWPQIQGVAGASQSLKRKQ